MLSEICFKITLYRDSEAKSGWRYRLAVSQLIAEVAAAAAAKSSQSCPTLCDPIDGSPPGSPRPWDSPGKNTGVGEVDDGGSLSIFPTLTVAGFCIIKFKDLIFKYN